MREITDIREIQTLLLNMLRYLKGVCEANGLTYYLSNGTLLGAVKYGSFISWDDDVDIMMPRQDYEKLMELLNGSSGDTDFSQLRRKQPGTDPMQS